MTTPTLVTADTTAHLLPNRFWPVEVPWGGILHPGGCPVRVQMWWSVQDPYAVNVEFHNGREWIPWRVDRGLLAVALVGPVTHRELLGPVGEGDIQIDLWDQALILTLDSPSGHAAFLFNPDVVAGFLTDTYQVVQLGMEQLGVDWDAALAAVLRERGRL